MKKSTERILTTHSGSLARPPGLTDLLRAQESGKPYDHDMFAELLKKAVAEIVRKQVSIGIDVVNDGEQSKPDYYTYVKNRLSGFQGEAYPPEALQDLIEFPEFSAQVQASGGFILGPSSSGPITWKGEAAIQTDIANFKAALRGLKPEEAFLPSPSPGIIAMRLKNEYYPNQPAYLYALADAIRHEYNAITRAGLLLQVDAPDLAEGRHMQDILSVREFRKRAEIYVEVLNHALQRIPRAAAHVIRPLCTFKNEL